jgi:hypothetical protein
VFVSGIGLMASGHNMLVVHEVRKPAAEASGARS